MTKRKISSLYLKNMVIMFSMKKSIQAKTGRAETAPAGLLAVTHTLGAHIAEARKRRRLRQIDVAEMAGVTLPTLRAVESGNLGTSIGAYAGVLWALGMENSLTTIATIENDADGQVHERAALRRGVAQRRIGKTRMDDNF